MYSADEKDVDVDDGDDVGASEEEEEELADSANEFAGDVKYV